MVVKEELNQKPLVVYLHYIDKANDPIKLIFKAEEASRFIKSDIKTCVELTLNRGSNDEIKKRVYELIKYDPDYYLLIRKGLYGPYWMGYKGQDRRESGILNLIEPAVTEDYVECNLLEMTILDHRDEHLTFDLFPGTIANPFKEYKQLFVENTDEFYSAFSFLLRWISANADYLRWYNDVLEFLKKRLEGKQFNEAKYEHNTAFGSITCEEELMRLERHYRATYINSLINRYSPHSMITSIEPGNIFNNGVFNLKGAERALESIVDFLSFKSNTLSIEKTTMIKSDSYEKDLFLFKKTVAEEFSQLRGEDFSYERKPKLVTRETGRKLYFPNSGFNEADEQENRASREALNLALTLLDSDSLRKALDGKNQYRLDINSSDIESFSSQYLVESLRPIQRVMFSNIKALFKSGLVNFESRYIYPKRDYSREIYNKEVPKIVYNPK